MKAKFTQTTEFTAIKFEPDKHPWHRSIQRQTIDGEIPDFEAYNCIIPCDHVYTIYPGDWIVVDDMNNAVRVIDERFFDMFGIKLIEEIGEK